MAGPEDEGLVVMKRYIATGAGSIEEVRAVGRSQIAKMQERIVTSPEQNEADTVALVEQTKKEPLAYDAEETNDKVYSFDTALWKATYGSRMKISSGLWPDGRTCSLTEAEEAMLDLYLERAEIRDGQDILDLGCGYGCITLYVAQRFPNARLVAHSMAPKQIDFIKSEAERLHLSNITTVQSDITDLSVSPASFDRIIAVQLLEYLGNYEELFARLSRWLRPEGLFFTEFCVHATHCHEPLEIEAGYTGEVCRSFEFLKRFQRDLTLQAAWWVDGRMYSKSMDAWLDNWHTRRDEIMPILRLKHGSDAAAEREYRNMEWYFAISSEAMNFNEGKTSGPAHYLFRNQV